MTVGGDDWGRDPSVRYGREVFRSMEAAQEALLRGAGVSALDPRLRRWRELALRLFQEAWKDHGSADPSASGALYARCLARALQGSGVASEHPT